MSGVKPRTGRQGVDQQLPLVPKRSAWHRSLVASEAPDVQLISECVRDRPAVTGETRGIRLQGGEKLGSSGRATTNRQMSLRRDHGARLENPVPQDSGLDGSARCRG